MNDPDGKYPFHALGHRGHGAIDMKMTSRDMMVNYEMIVVGGPTWDQQPTFKWSESDLNATLSHIGQPDEWKFDPVHVTWSGGKKIDLEDNNELICD